MTGSASDRVVCEILAMRLILLGKGARLASVTCQEEAVYIGSHKGCEICLPDPGVAAQVGMIYAEDEDAWTFEQLAQGEQVQLNGALVTEKVELKSGDQLKIHDYIIRVEAERAPSVEPPPKPPASRTSVARMTRFVQYRLPPGATIKRTDDAITVQPEQMTSVGQANVVLGQCNT
ncbi:unnamed protein product, partial [marine sediment metagenome]